MSRDVELRAGDGHPLAATVFDAAGADCWLVLNSAMGVRRRFYRHLAQFLCDAGIGVVTYDYRGIGDSVLQHEQVKLADWGQQDFSAVLRWVRAERAPARLAALGHSVGGQIAGLAPELVGLDAFIGVATQSGYWRNWSGWERARVGALWYAGVPLLTRMFGHFPASRLGIGQDLPTGIARQWAEWGRDPHYLRSERIGPQPQFYAAFRGRLRTYLVRGDEFASEHSVRAWHDWFPQARREFVDLGLRNSAGRKTGHFGFFDPGIGAEWWPGVADFLRSRG
jgi:predicted alpha/beta hydrolase